MKRAYCGFDFHVSSYFAERPKPDLLFVRPVLAQALKPFAKEATSSCKYSSSDNFICSRPRNNVTQFSLLFLDHDPIERCFVRSVYCDIAKKLFIIGKFHKEKHDETCSELRICHHIIHCCVVLSAWRQSK